jgi:hypothetical protein
VLLLLLFVVVVVVVERGARRRHSVSRSWNAVAFSVSHIKHSIFKRSIPTFPSFR